MLAFVRSCPHPEWKLFGKSSPLRNIKPCSSRNDMDALSIALPFGCKITAKIAPLEQMHPRQPLQLSATCCHRIWKPLFLGKILPNGVEIFSKTEGSTFYFQSPLPYLCTCTITVDAKRKDPVEERKSERQMKIETSRKFLDCTIIAYPFLINGYNFVLQTSWKMEIAYKNGTAFREIPMKEEYGLSMLLASGFLQGCAAKHESGRWGLHQWLLSCGGVCKQNGTANQGMVFILIG